MDAVNGELWRELPSPVPESRPLALDILAPPPAVLKWVWKASIRSSVAWWSWLPPQLTSVVILVLWEKPDLENKESEHPGSVSLCPPLCHVSLAEAFTICDLTSQTHMKEDFQSCSGRDQSSA